MDARAIAVAFEVGEQLAPDLLVGVKAGCSTGELSKDVHCFEEGSEPPIPRLAFAVMEFCRAHGISIEAAAEWCRNRERNRAA